MRPLSLLTPAGAVIAVNGVGPGQVRTGTTTELLATYRVLHENRTKVRPGMASPNSSKPRDS